MGRRILLLLCCGVLGVAGCSGGSDLEATPVDLDALAAATELDLTSGVPTAVWFTTPWCRRCEDQLRDTLEAASTHCEVRTVVVVGRAGEGAIGQFLEANEVAASCPGPPAVVADVDGTAFGAVPVITAPTWLFIDNTGAATVDRDVMPADELEDRLVDLTR